MTHAPTTTQDTQVRKNNLLILVSAPSHDRLTKYTAKLLQSLPIFNVPTEVHKFESPLTYDQLLAQKLIDPNDTNVALIFGGHGEDFSLEGPGAHPGTANYSNVRSIFYDDSNLAQGPEFLLAFCCSAATGLGESYKLGPAKRAFVGFKTEIGILTAEGVYAKCWRKIIHKSASALIGAKNRREMRKAILDLYDEEYAFFDSGQGSNHEHALLMKMYLFKQKEVLRFIRT